MGCLSVLECSRVYIWCFQYRAKHISTLLHQARLVIDSQLIIRWHLSAPVPFVANCSVPTTPTGPHPNCSRTYGKQTSMCPQKLKYDFTKMWRLSKALELFQNSFVLVRGDSLKHVYDNWAKNYFKYQSHCQYHQYQYQYKCPFPVVIPIFLNHLSFQPRPLCKVEKVDPALLLSRLSKLLRHTPFKNRHSIVQPLL